MQQTTVPTVASFVIPACTTMQFLATKIPCKLSHHIWMRLYVWAIYSMFITTPDEADEFLNRGLAIDSANTSAMTGKAIVLERKGKYKESYEIAKYICNTVVISSVLANVM